MRFSKKALLSVSMAAVMTATCVVVPATVSAADSGEADASTSTNLNEAYNLAPTVGEGNILHAFNWYFNDVRRYMKDIAEAGYTSVQVSPVQGNKATINVQSYACDWWATYQPINFEIGNNYGTKADFKAMCEEADKYGVKIIVDIVANHMAQADTGVAGEVHENVIADIKDDPDCWHNTTSTTSDVSRYSMTQYTLDGIPDLNTSNEKVQSYVKSLLKECIDSGADGFRFDAAKHIELDTDEAVNGVEYASDFWSNITSYARDIKPDIFIYGEVLAPFGTDATNYTQYMRITDSDYGNKVRNATRGTNTPGLISPSFENTDGDDYVLWIESHDNYNSWTAVKTLTEVHFRLGWGIIGARQNSPALYLVRPEHASKHLAYDELMGGPGDLMWQDSVITTINDFKNQFVGQSETLYSDTKMFFVQRGTTGMVATNYSTADYEANLQTTLDDGTYTDQVSGAEFTVTGGVLTGTIPAKTVVVLYTPDEAAPEATVTLNDTVIETSSESTSFVGDTAELKVSFSENVTSYEVVENGKSLGVVTGSNNDLNTIIGEGVADNEEITVTVKASSNAGNIAHTYYITKKAADAPIIAYFDAKGNESWDLEDAPGIYCFAKDANGKAITEYPGYLMTKVPGTTLVKVELPSNTAVVKFNEGPVSTGLDGRTIPSTVVEYGTAKSPQNRESGGLDITGSMVWTNGCWQNYNDEGKSFYECTAYAFGDVNGDGKVNLVDAILANKATVQAVTLTENEAYAADLNDNFDIELIDALAIQKYVLHIN